MNYFTGIDNGLNGGIVVLDEQQRVVKKLVMPVIQGKKKEYDIQTIGNFFAEW